MWKGKDMSNFMIGIPLVDSTDFQGSILADFDSTLIIRGAPPIGGQQINITNAYVRDIKNGNDK